MITPLRISLIQLAIRWGEKASNVANCVDLLNGLAGVTDLVVLPEAFSTGFALNDDKVGETVNGQTMATLRQCARQSGFAITGSFIAKSGRYYYNRGFFIPPNNDEAYYSDKRHLFRMAGEDKHFSRGKSNSVIPYLGWSLRLLVCYDLRFPVWSRNIENSYDILIYVANWPAVRRSAWDILLPARAVENQSYVCGVNCVGIDARNNVYSGGSAFYGPMGEKLLDCGSDANIICTGTACHETLDRYRNKFPFWKDSDRFNIKD
jgi:predicted amidohydrolase